jgi:hypothetical protein
MLIGSRKLQRHCGQLDIFDVLNKKEKRVTTDLKQRQKEGSRMLLKKKVRVSLEQGKYETGADSLFLHLSLDPITQHGEARTHN